jgi:predicted RNA-binding Zn-ribbon protein involved in translation (DUF1610 family)
MGRVYTVKCPTCAFNKVFQIGSGLHHETIMSEMRNSIEQEELGIEAKQFLDLHPKAEIVAVASVYHCNRCGDLENRTRIQIKDAKTSYTIRNYCEKCNGRMGPAPDVQKIHCPTCKVPMEIISMSNWDGCDT